MHRKARRVESTCRVVGIPVFHAAPRYPVSVRNPVEDTPLRAPLPRLHRHRRESHHKRHTHTAHLKPAERVVRKSGTAHRRSSFWMPDDESWGARESRRRCADVRLIEGKEARAYSGQPIIVLAPSDVTEKKRREVTAALLAIFKASMPAGCCHSSENASLKTWPVSAVSAHA